MRRQKGQDNIGEIESLLGYASRLKSQLENATQAEEKLAAQDKLKETEVRIVELSKSALQMFDLALQLKNETTSRADINNIRYLQSYCYFAMRQYFESALIGEFLLAKYPTIDGTRQAMTLMIRSYSQLHSAATEGDKEFERTRLADACRAVVERWPGSNEAGTAANTLTRLAIIDGDFATAERIFSSSSPKRFLSPCPGCQVGTKIVV